jgi:hypothetical protein
MSWRSRGRHLGAAVPVCVAVFALTMAVGRSDVAGQGRAGGPQVPQTGRGLAPVDITGTWVSIVTEDWRWRMVTPPKGDVASIPVSAEGRKAAAAWNLDADNAGGNQCKAYGVGGIMRQPGRIRVSWQDDQTLKFEFDAGTQTRLLHFGAGRAGEAGGAGGAATGQAPSWQGYSVATWRRPARMDQQRDKNAGDLRVLTTRLRAGYLRKNGVPYSENAMVEEFFDAFTEPNGDSWLVIDTIVTDPTYLTQPYVNSVAFKKQRDASGWDPTPCRTDQPR